MSRHTGPVLQAKWRVGPADDPAEAAADPFADAVVDALRRGLTGDRAVARADPDAHLPFVRGACCRRRRRRRRAAGEVDPSHPIQPVIRGTYTVQDLGGHTLKVDDGKGGWRSVKRIALVRLDDDDEYVELGDRPDEEMADLENKTVIVAGRLYVPAANDDEEMAASDPLPTLTSITKVERSGS